MYARRWWILGVLCVVLALIGIDVTVLAVAIPDLTLALHADTSEVQWIIDVYSLVFAGFVVAMGAVSDRYGRRLLLLIGVVALGVFSGLGAFSQNPVQLTAARALTGLAAAMIMPSTLSIIANVFDDDERPRAIGIWSGVAGLGFILGPIIGGFLLSAFYWGSVLLINVPIVVVAFVLIVWLVPESKDPHSAPIDYAGTALSVIGLAALIFGVIEGPNSGWGSPQVVAAFVVAACMLTAFVFWELRARHPMLDVRAFKIPAFGVPALVIALVMFVMFGLILLLPQYLQFVEDQSTLLIGLLLAPLSATWSVAAVGAPFVVKRVGEKATMVSALVIVCAGLAVFFAIGTGPSIAIVVVASVVAGVGMGLVETPATVLLLDALPAEKAGVASAVNDLTREGGGAIGIAVLGSIANAVYIATIVPSLTNLAPKDADTVESGIGGAVELAVRQGNDTLLAAARSAFVTGYKYAMAAGLVVMAISVAICAIWLPNRAKLAELRSRR